MKTRDDLGTVMEAAGGSYRIALDAGADGGTETVAASLRGRVKRTELEGDRVVIGDRVRLAGVASDDATVEAVLPRRNVILRRPPQASRPRAIVANVDRVLVVIAATHPPLDPGRLDRYLVIAEAAGVEAFIVLNKCDLPGSEDALELLEEVYATPGYRVLATSTVTARGLEEFRELLRAGIAVLLGPSGAGKSTLLNAIEPALDLRTGELSRKLARGRHTTVSGRLLELSTDGWVADTPGFEYAGPWGIAPEELDRLFPELARLAGGCRFRECTHLHEPDCAVRAELEAGTIAESRMESYRAIRAELEEL